MPPIRRGKGCTPVAADVSGLRTESSLPIVSFQANLAVAFPWSGFTVSCHGESLAPSMLLVPLAVHQNTQPKTIQVPFSHTLTKLLTLLCTTHKPQAVVTGRTRLHSHHSASPIPGSTLKDGSQAQTHKALAVVEAHPPLACPLWTILPLFTRAKAL